MAPSGLVPLQEPWRPHHGAAAIAMAAMFDSPRPLLAARSGGRADRPARSRVCDLPSETAKPSGSWATAAAGERDGRPRRVKLSDGPRGRGRGSGAEKSGAAARGLSEKISLDGLHGRRRLHVGSPRRTSSQRAAVTLQWPVTGVAPKNRRSRRDRVFWRRHVRRKSGYRVSVE